MKATIITFFAMVVLSANAQITNENLVGSWNIEYLNKFEADIVFMRKRVDFNIYKTCSFYGGVIEGFIPVHKWILDPNKTIMIEYQNNSTSLEWQILSQTENTIDVEETKYQKGAKSIKTGKLILRRMHGNGVIVDNPEWRKNEVGVIIPTVWLKDQGNAIVNDLIGSWSIPTHERPYSLGNLAITINRDGTFYHSGLFAQVRRCYLGKWIIENNQMVLSFLTENGSICSKEEDPKPYFGQWIIKPDGKHFALYRAFNALPIILQKLK